MRSGERDFSRNPLRLDGMDKILGRTPYLDDLHLRDPDLLFAATVRTTLPGGVLEGIDFGGGTDWSDMTVVTARDISGTNAVRLLENDQPVLVEREFRHAGEAAVLLAHPDRRRLRKALLQVRLAERPAGVPVFTIEAALQGQAETIPGNTYTEYRLEKSGPRQETGHPDTVIAVEVETPSQEQLYIEPQGMVARLAPDGVVRVEGSMQCPYYVLDALVQCLGLPASRIQVVQTATGGGFGGKEDFPSVIACHAALLALRAGGRPVRLVLDRAEDLRVTPKRHPSRSRVRLAATPEGRLQSVAFDFDLDGGAYRTLSPVVLSRGVIHAPGPYRCPDVRVTGRAVFTSHPPFGAFRGFGAPQSIFAMEVAMDRLASRLEMDPAEFRRKNLLCPGDTGPTGDIAGEDTHARKALDVALERSGYARRRTEHEAWNRAGGPTRRGIGLATFCHGAGFTGNGETHLASRVTLAATAEGKVELLVSNTEIGQGAATTLVQVAAEALGIPMDLVVFGPVDTARVPNSGPTVASRTCMVVGKLLEKAARRFLEQLPPAGGKGNAPGRPDFQEACRKLHALGGAGEVTETYAAPPGPAWDEKTFQGRAYASYAWAAYVAEVEVDLVTFETRILHFTAVQEIGHAVNPQIALGQIEGGIVQGIGWALLENVVWNGSGVMANDRLATYIIPTSADIDGIDVILLEEGQGAGPRGAKGIGELPMDGPAPAIANAVRHALGVDVDRLPLTPEYLHARLAEQQEVHSWLSK